MRIHELLKRTGSRPGHIFNLGHGILPETPVENVKACVRDRPRIQIVVGQAVIVGGGVSGLFRRLRSGARRDSLHPD